MKNKIIKINRDVIKRKMYVKVEIKKLVLSSIIQNLNIKPIIRANAIRKICYLKRYNFISKQNNNICLLTGRSKGTLRITNLSRHKFKQLSILGNVQNFKTKSW